MSGVDVTVIIPTHNQEARLALVLAGLAAQGVPRGSFEVLVVDDGCTDGTAALVERVSGQGEITVRRLGGERRGRNASRNLGLAEARGGLTVFLDADALPAPDLLECYVDARRRHPGAVLFSGLQHHVPDLEYLEDPRTGAVRGGLDVPSVVLDLIAARREDLLLTEDHVRGDFERVRRRSRVGSYPDAGSARRQAQARELVGSRPGSVAAWLAFIPHNGAAPTGLLRAAGGFDEDIPFSEGWELAYRLQRQHDASVVAVDASSYHLYHHHDFADASQVQSRYDAIEYMAAKHHDPRVRLVYFWYAHLWRDGYIPEAAVIPDLFTFERLYQALPDSVWRQYETVLRNHPNQFPLREIEVSYGSCA